jgi:hypothetical protein
VFDFVFKHGFVFEREDERREKVGMKEKMSDVVMVIFNILIYMNYFIDF